MSDNVNQRFITFSKPFIMTAKNVFETMVFTKINPSGPTIKKDNKSLGDHSAVLPIVGNVEVDGKEVSYKAMIVVSFPTETYLKVASAMLMEEYTEFNEEIADVGSEIVNMVVGNAKRELSGQGYTTSMASPTMINGKGHQLRYPANTTVILIPVECDHGTFYIEVSYSDDSAS